MIVRESCVKLTKILTGVIFPGGSGLQVGYHEHCQPTTEDPTAAPQYLYPGGVWKGGGMHPLFPIPLTPLRLEKSWRRWGGGASWW
jgi:hypothetical protein